MNVTQWSVLVAELDPAVGSEQAGRRPVLVISGDVINQALPIVTVLPLTSRKDGRRIYPTEVLLAAGTAGLSRDSLVMAHQVRTISKHRLTEFLGEVGDAPTRLEIRNAVQVLLDW